MDGNWPVSATNIAIAHCKTDPFRVGGTASGAAQQLQGIAEAKVRPMEEQRLPA